MSEPMDNAKLVDDGLWECPDCAFAFDAAHTDTDGGHTCPCCAEARLTTALASANEMNERLVAGLEEIATLNAGGPHVSAKDCASAALACLNTARKIARALLASMKGDGSNG